MTHHTSTRDLAAFTSLKVFPTLTHLAGIPTVFALHGVIGILGCLVVFLFVPETKGKSLLEIETLFAKNKGHAKNILSSDTTFTKAELPPIQITVITSTSENQSQETKPEEV